jgi:hypothetical protein
MEYGAALSYPRQDADWIKKLAIGGVLSFIPLGSLLLTGYQIAATKRVIDDQPGLPEWTDFGRLFTRGLLAAVALMIYFLPAIVLSSCIIIPVSIGLTDSSGNIAAGNEGIYFGVISCVYLVLLIYIAFAIMLHTAGLGRYAVSDRFGVFLEFGALMREVSGRLGVYLIIVLLYMLVGAVGALLGTLVCVVGLIITLPYVQLVYANLTGQAHRLATTN